MKNPPPKMSAIVVLTVPVFGSVPEPLAMTRERGEGDGEVLGNGNGLFVPNGPLLLLLVSVGLWVAGEVSASGVAVGNGDGLGEALTVNVRVVVTVLPVVGSVYVKVIVCFPGAKFCCNVERSTLKLPLESVCTCVVIGFVE